MHNNNSKKQWVSPQLTVVAIQGGANTTPIDGGRRKGGS